MNMNDQNVPTLYSYRGEIIRIINGDTLDVDIDLGFHIGVEIRVRLLDTDAPKLNAKTDPKDYDRVLEAKRFVEMTSPVGTPVVVNTAKDSNNYNFYRADIWLPNGLLLNKLVRDFLKHQEEGN